MSEKQSSISRRKFLATSTAFTSGFFLGAPNVTSNKKKVISNDTDPDYFVLIADLHMDENPNKLSNGWNMFDNLEITVNRILNNEEYGMPSGVIVLGDIANTHGHMGEYGLAWKLLRHLSKAGIPVHFAMGNHDNRGNFYRLFPDQVPKTLVRTRHVELIEAPNNYHIVLDTLARITEYIPGGELGGIQRAWLDEALKTYNDKPVILHGHHYPWPNTQPDGTVNGLKDYEEFLELVHSHKHVKAYCFGHSHNLDILLDKDLHLVNVPMLGGNPGTQPTGFIHAFFYPDRLAFEVECIDTEENWHGDSGTLGYRSDETITGVQPAEKSAAIQLHQNYPNPFNPSTSIRYYLSHADHISLEVYSSDGRLVATIVDAFQNAGQHEVSFDASRFASGTYVYRLRAGEEVLTRTMMLIK